MITYTDFSETKYTPFASGLDETIAYLGWLDLFLSAQHTILQNEAEADLEQIQKELKAGAQILYERQLLSQGKPFDAQYGITFLATNRYNNFDNAFLRRITYSVKLDKPNAETRMRLFQSILPASARVDELLDFRFFAEQFELTGSNIKAILYNAAFMAAAENRGICNEHIARAVKYELEKLGKMVLAAEMGIYGIYL